MRYQAIKSIGLLNISVLLMAIVSCSGMQGQRPQEKVAADAATKIHPVTDIETAKLIAEVRRGTEKYLDFEKAKADGYFQGSGNKADIGYHFINPAYLSTFDLQKPPILIYIKEGGSWKLVGTVFVTLASAGDPNKVLPFKGAEYLPHPAMCHFKDGSMVMMAHPDGCTRANNAGAELGVWHPNLDVVSVWAWYPNPKGVFAYTNPFLEPMTAGAK